MAEGFSKRAILSQSDGFFDVGINIFSSQILMADGRKQGQPHSGCVGVSGKRDHGNAHPEGFAGRGGAVVGKGVEGHIHAGVGGEVLGGACKEAEEFDSVVGNSSGGEFIADAGENLGVLEVGALDQEA